MLVPAGIFVVINLLSDGGAIAGWAVPVATDIAFAIAVLSIVGRWLPNALAGLPAHARRGRRPARDHHHRRVLHATASRSGGSAASVACIALFWFLIRRRHHHRVGCWCRSRCWRGASCTRPACTPRSRASRWEWRCPPSRARTRSTASRSTGSTGGGPSRPAWPCPSSRCFAAGVSIDGEAICGRRVRPRGPGRGGGPGDRQAGRDPALHLPGRDLHAGVARPRAQLVGRARHGVPRGHRLHRVAAHR